MPPLTLDEPGTFRSCPFMITCYLPRDFPLGVGPERLLVEGYCDKKISCFASSIGSGAPGLTQHRRVYHGLHGSVSEKLIDRSSLSEAYYQTSNTVDRHNQNSTLVTHGFAWHTQHYSHRVFGSVLSYITTNAFLAMKWSVLLSMSGLSFELWRFCARPLFSGCWLPDNSVCSSSFTSITCSFFN